jgi:hypothetical protein
VIPKFASDGPSARISTRFGVLPVIMKPPIMRPSPV